MKNILVIMKKELYRVFQDRRLVLSMFIVPGLLIYVLYSFMGSALTEEEVDTTSYNIVLINDASTNSLANYINQEYKDLVVIVKSDDLDDAKTKLFNKELFYIVELPTDFDSLVEQNKKPSINVYYNPTDNVSKSTNIFMESVLQKFNLNLLGVDDSFSTSTSYIYDEKKSSGEGFALLLPFLILSFLFSSVISVTPESIAGEKERGTISTLLVTPTKRSHIALGKIFGLSILSVIGALSSFIGVIASLPKLLGTGSVSMYSPLEYLTILLVLISTVLLIVGLVSVLSAYAKNIKEASLYSMPILGVSMLVGVMSMINGAGSHKLYEYFIPIYNSVISLSGIFSFNFSLSGILVGIGSNLVFTSLIIFGLTKMFKSEKIMFNS